MPRDTCAKFLSTSEQLPIPTSLSTMQSHMPNNNFVVATATLFAVGVCFHNSALFCFTLKAAYNVLLQQELLYFGHTNLGSQMQLGHSMSNHPDHDTLNLRIFQIHTSGRHC